MGLDGAPALAPSSEQVQLTGAGAACMAALTPGLVDVPAERLAESCTLRGARLVSGGGAASTSHAAQVISREGGQGGRGGRVGGCERAIGSTSAHCVVVGGRGGGLVDPVDDGQGVVPSRSGTSGTMHWLTPSRSFLVHGASNPMGSSRNGVGGGGLR